MDKLGLKLLIASLILYPPVFFASTLTEPKSTAVRAAANPVTKPEKPLLADNLSATFTLGSNYIFRGLTQTENLPTVQGGFTYTFPIGLYLTVWGANNKFIGTDINMEMDPGIGFNKEIKKNFTIDISFYRYYYPSDKIWNYSEWLGQVNYEFLQSNIGYSNNVFNSKRTGVYIDGGVNFSIPKKYSLNIEGMQFNALLGYYSLPNLPDFLSLSYTTYSISLSKDFKNYNLALQFTNTNQRAFYDYYGGPHVFATLTANLS